MQTINVENLTVTTNSTDSKIHLYFLHGFGETADSFNAIADHEQLLKKYKIIIPNLPGCNNTMADKACQSITEHADKLVKLITMLSANKKIILITHSMASLIGEKIADKLKQQLLLFISIEGFIIPDTVRFSSRVLTCQRAEEFYSLLKAEVHKQVQQENVPESYYQHILTCSPETLYIWAKSCYQTPSQFVNLNCKRIYLCGSKSANQAELALLKKHAIDVIQYDNAGHWLMYDVASFYDDVFKAINDFKTAG